MTTPITDEASFSTVYQGEIVEASFARRLELDRAALMEALEWMLDAYSQDDPSVHLSEVGKAAASALSAARANFPES